MTRTTMRGSDWRVTVTLLVAPLVLGACRGETGDNGRSGASIVARDSSRPVGPKDIRIVSTDSAIELSLIGDSLITGLAANARAKVRAATDTASVTGTGLAAKLEKIVKSKVQTVLNMELAFPVSSVGDVRYNAGSLEFFDNNGKRMAELGGNRSNETSRKGVFSAPDAQAFTTVFRAKKSLAR